MFHEITRYLTRQAVREANAMLEDHNMVARMGDRLGDFGDDWNVFGVWHNGEEIFLVFPEVDNEAMSYQVVYRDGFRSNTSGSRGFSITTTVDTLAAALKFGIDYRVSDR